MDDAKKAKVWNGMLQAVREVGDMLLQPAEYDVVKKGHANYATEMDLKAQNMLVEHMKRLEPLLPDTGFILEEGGSTGLKEYTFVIDPIDGTTNFMRGLGQSAISLALLKDGLPWMGMVYNPWLDDLFCAEKGGGALCNGKAIRVSERPMDDAIISCGTSPYHTELAGRTMDVIGRLFRQCGDIRRFGSAALELCYIAAGRTEGFYETVLRPWDYAAGVLILQEAGGIAQPIDYPEWDFTKVTGVMGGTPVVFEELKHCVMG